MKKLVVAGVLLIVIAGRMTYVNNHMTVTTKTLNNKSVDVEGRPEMYHASGQVNVNIK